MPKLSKEVVSIKFTAEIKSVEGSGGPYDMVDLRCGQFRFAQLTLIRCEQTKSFMQLLSKVGVELKVEVEPRDAKKEVSGSVHSRPTKKATKKVPKR